VARGARRHLTTIRRNRSDAETPASDLGARRPRHRDRGRRGAWPVFLRASLKGWEFCRDKPAECVEIVLKESPVLGRDHQAWMMAEINKLVWGPPAPKTPLGKMDPEAFKRTADIALKFGVIKKSADNAAYTHEIWEMAQKK
jgi:hypothetical protein